MKQFFYTAMLAGVLIVPSMCAQDPGRIQRRKENQQDRIAQGVASGQLAPHETANLERKEARLNHEIRDDREDHGGKLTTKEKRQINRQQNKLSRRIYHEKHDQNRVPK